MKKILLLIIVAANIFTLHAQRFTPGNIVVSRYGDGASSLPATNITVPVFLDEYKPDGTYVRSIPLPVVSGTGDRVLSGSAIIENEGFITLSPNGQYLNLIGHNRAVGSTYSGSTQRTIGIFTSDGDLRTTFCPSNVGNPRCAITNNGGNMWFGGSNKGVRYKRVGAGGDTIKVTSSVPNAIKSLYIYNGQLYVTSAASGGTVRKVGTDAIASPLHQNQPVAALPGEPATPNPGQMILLDTDSSTVEPDLLYMTDVTEGALKKWVFTAGSWQSMGMIDIDGTTDNLNGLTGEILLDGTVTLYGQTDTKVMKFKDANPVTSALSSLVNIPQVLVTAGDNTRLRGVAFTPGTIHYSVSPVFAKQSSAKYAELIQSKTDLIQNITSQYTIQRYPGVEETNIRYVSNKGKNMSIFFLKVDLVQAGIDAEVATAYNRADSTTGTQTVNGQIEAKNEVMADRQVIAGVNADYFYWDTNTNKIVAEGLLFKDGVMIKDHPVIPSRSIHFFGIKNNGQAVLGDKKLYLLNKEYLQNATGGRYLLNQFGEVAADYLLDVSVEPRTTVGLFNPKTAVFMVVDGRRSSYSNGLTVLEMAKIFKAIGVQDALNLDGGGSTTLVVRNDTTGVYETRNKVSDAAGERGVSDSWVITINNKILAARGAKFKAHPQGTTVSLTWETEGDDKKKLFVVERTSDGERYEDVQKVDAASASEGILKYSVTDFNPLRGNSYYRLKQIDEKGNKVYSPALPVSMITDMKPVLTVYPNPAQNNITLSIKNDNGRTLGFTLINLGGQVIMSGTGVLSEINSQINEVMPRIQPGFYVVKVSDGQKILTSGFIKN